MKSALPLITSWVIFVPTVATSDVVILSKLPFGMPGMSNFGFFFSTYSRLRSTMS